MIAVTRRVIGRTLVRVVFAHERLATISTTGDYMLLITFRMVWCSIVRVILTGDRLVTIRATGIYAIAVAFYMIGLALVYVKLGTVYRLMAGSTDKMLWMPYRPQGRKIVPIDRLSTSFTDKL